MMLAGEGGDVGVPVAADEPCRIGDVDEDIAAALGYEYAVAGLSPSGLLLQGPVVGRR